VLLVVALPWWLVQLALALVMVAVLLAWEQEPWS